VPVKGLFADLLGEMLGEHDGYLVDFEGDLRPAALEGEALAKAALLSGPEGAG
jgi:hypothetical protein